MLGVVIGEPEDDRVYGEDIVASALACDVQCSGDLVDVGASDTGDLVDAQAGVGGQEDLGAGASS